jgi:acyl-CoA thioesterase FadM
MTRNKIEMPDLFSFSALIPIRITDLNYGGHVGNDSILSIIHEARVRFLRHFDFEEFNIGGASLIMSDVAIEFKNELFYGDEILAHVAAADFSRVGFTIYYKLEKAGADKSTTVALARTGMVCFDYDLKKIVRVPEIVKEKLSV